MAASPRRPRARRPRAPPPWDQRLERKDLRVVRSTVRQVRHVRSATLNASTSLCVSSLCFTECRWGLWNAEEFCRGVWPRLVRSLASYTGDAGMAEELAQEALVRALERWDRVADMDAPEMWVYRTAINLARSRFRRRQAERRANRRVSAPGPSIAPSADLADVLTMRQELLRLPSRQRAAVVLRYHADLTVDETAAVMDCAPGTVKALTHQALTRLRERLAEPRSEETIES